MTTTHDMDGSTHYGLEDGEPLGEGLKRIAREEIDSVAAGLREEGDIHEGVHNARKRLKRVRAVLRLVRDDIGAERFEAENVFLRDCGRELADVRDAKVAIETLDALVEQLGPGLELNTFGSIRRLLVESFEETADRILVVERRHKRVAAALESSAGRIQLWPIGADRFETIAPGIRRVYRRGRKRRDEAYADPSFERFHEWRKRVKYLWNQVHVLETLVPRMMTPLSESLERIADLVGDSTDLAELALWVRDDESAAPDPRTRQLLLDVIATRRAALRALARPVADEVWSERPGDFVDRLATYWTAWRRAIPVRESAEAAQAETGGEPSLEIERKFLVLGDPRGPSMDIRQGYLSIDDPEVRVRLAGGTATLTVKSEEGGPGSESGARTGDTGAPDPVARTEIEMPVDLETGERLYELCRWKLTKTRYVNGRWEIDRFETPRRFLLAEVELTDADEPLPTPPAWLRIVREVTDDPAYLNRNLASEDGATSGEGGPALEAHSGGAREPFTDPFEPLDRFLDGLDRALFGHPPRD